MTLSKTQEIPPRLLEIAKLNRHKFTENDPAIAIDFNKAGLQQHHPNNDAAIARIEIANAIVAAGMVAVPAKGEDSTVFFTGRLNILLTAQDEVVALGWPHHTPGMLDVGIFYLVTPRGANNVEFAPSRLIFNR